MLRIAFIVGLLLTFVTFALRGPLEALVLYLWIGYFRPESWAWTPYFRTLPLSSWAGVYLLIRVAMSSTRFRFDKRVALMGGFLGLAIVAGTQSRWFDISSGMFTDILKAFVVTYLLALMVDNPANMRIVLQTVALSLGFEQAKQGWVRLIMSPGSQNDNPIVFLGDNNAVAGGMMMLVPMFIILGRTSKWKLERWVYWFMTVGVLYRGLSTYSRGGFLAAIAMGLVFVVRSPKRFPALVAASVVAVVLSVSLPQAYWDRMSSVRGQADDEGKVVYDDSAQSRLYFWQVAVKMANDNIIGVGPGTYMYAYALYDTSDGAYGRNRAVHSSWFGTLAEMGYPGLILLIINVSMAWFSTARAQYWSSRGRVPREYGIIGGGLEASLVAFIVAGSFLNMQYIEMMWHLIGMTMGLTWMTNEALLATAPGMGMPGPLPIHPMNPGLGPVRRAS